MSERFVECVHKIKLSYIFFYRKNVHVFYHGIESRKSYRSTGSTCKTAE